MSATTTAAAARSELSGSFEGELIAPADGRYDEARKLFNAMIDRKPAVIARCVSPPDVGRVIAFARAHEVDEDRVPSDARDAWIGWYQSTPDTPCIAICSTSQGDEVCKGCGRTFDEVQFWTEMSPTQKRQVWRRITLSAEAWRFNRYAERANE